MKVKGKKKTHRLPSLYAERLPASGRDITLPPAPLGWGWLGTHCTAPACKPGLPKAQKCPCPCSAPWELRGLRLSWCASPSVEFPALSSPHSCETEGNSSPSVLETPRQTLCQRDHSPGTTQAHMALSAPSSTFTSLSPVRGLRLFFLYPRISISLT